MGNEELQREIDNAHKSANEALKNKNFELYAEHFSDNLKYTQLNGRTIDKKQLMNDTAVYFNRILSSSSDYQRISFEIGNETITERLIQKAQVAIKVFIFFSKKWTIEREGIYEWRKSDDKWEIINVKIISEKVL
jgi:hypothetical protein